MKTLAGRCSLSATSFPNYVYTIPYHTIPDDNILYYSIPCYYTIVGSLSCEPSTSSDWPLKLRVPKFGFPKNKGLVLGVLVIRIRLCMGTPAYAHLTLEWCVHVSPQLWHRGIYHSMVDYSRVYYSMVYHNMVYHSMVYHSMVYYSMAYKCLLPEIWSLRCEVSLE